MTFPVAIDPAPITTAPGAAELLAPSAIASLLPSPAPAGADDAAYTVLVTSKSNKDNADNLKTLPNEALLSTLTSEDALATPFANSEVTTNDCVVRFQITLKILFIKNETPLHKFNNIKL